MGFSRSGFSRSSTFRASLVRPASRALGSAAPTGSAAATSTAPTTSTGGLGHLDHSPPGSGQHLVALALGRGFLLGNQLVLANCRTFDAGISHALAIEIDGPGGIVVARNHEIDTPRVAVAVHHPDDCDSQPSRLADRDGLLAHINNENYIGNPRHALDPGKGLVVFLTQATHPGEFLLGILSPLLFVRLDCQQILVILNGLLDGLPIRQHAAQPTIVHIVLTTAICLGFDGCRRLTLGAHEEDAASVRNGVADTIQAGLEIRQGLVQVEDMSSVAGPENIGTHEGIPAVGLVTEVSSGLEKPPNGQVGLFEDLGCGFFARRYGISSGRIAGRRRRSRRLSHFCSPSRFCLRLVLVYSPTGSSPAPQGRIEACVVPTTTESAAALGSRLGHRRPSRPQGGRPIGAPSARKFRWCTRR